MEDEEESPEYQDIRTGLSQKTASGYPLLDTLIFAMHGNTYKAHHYYAESSTLLCTVDDDPHASHTCFDMPVTDVEAAMRKRLTFVIQEEAQ